MTVTNSIKIPLGCDPYVYVTVYESEGSLVFFLGGAPRTEQNFDLDGLFFNLSDDSLATDLTVFPTVDTGVVTDYEADPNTLSGLSNGAELNDNYDVKLQFGTEPGATDGTVSTLGFTLYSDSGEPLTLADLDLDSFALVVDSDTDAGQVLLVDDNDPTTDDCYDLGDPHDPHHPQDPEDCIDVMEGTTAVIDLDMGTGSSSSDPAPDAEVLTFTLDNGDIGKGDVAKVKVDAISGDVSGANDVTVVDNMTDYFGELQLEKMGKDDGAEDVFRIDLSTFDDDFTITIKSEGAEDRIVIQDALTQTQNSDGSWDVTYLGEDGVEHSVTIQPGAASVEFDAPGDAGTGDGGVTYAIVGGTDADLFTVDAETGEVAFITEPDFENPGSHDGDNHYEVIVRATTEDGTQTDRTLDVCVENDCIRFDEGSTEPVVDLDCGTAVPHQGMDICHADGGRPTTITLTYDYGTTIDQVMDQEAGKSMLETFGNDSDGEVYIEVTNNDGGVIFAGTVAQGESFEVGTGERFSSETHVAIYDSQGGTMIQDIEFHTSCSQPLAIGDTFGSISLVGVTLEDASSMGVNSTGGGAGDLGVTYVILDGPDSHLFEVDPETGEVRFINPPDFENPQSANGDNMYMVTVRAINEDGSYEDKPLEICVENTCIKVEENTTFAIDLDVAGEGSTGVADPAPDAEVLTFTLDNGDIGKGDVAKVKVDTISGDVSGANDVTVVDDMSDFFGTLQLEKMGKDDGAEDVFRIDLSTFDDDFTITIKSEGAEDRIVIQDALTQTQNSDGSWDVTYLGEDGVEHSVTIQPGAASVEFGAVEAPTTYAIAGGPDAHLFTVDAETGVVEFIDAPDYEAPLDANGDNQYEVTVSATHSDGTVEMIPLDFCIEDILDSPICVAPNATEVVDLDLEVTCESGGPDDGTFICAFKDTDGKPVELELTYNFGDTWDQRMVQEDGKWMLDTFGYEDDGESYIRVLDKDGNEIFADTVAEGETFTLTNGGSTFSSETHVEIYDEQGGALLQDLEFHTSCSQPVAIGDTFGSITLTGATLENGRTFEGGGSETFDEPDLVYSISGGADAGMFTIDETTGVLSFLDGQEAGSTADADADGIFEVTVRAAVRGDDMCFTEEEVEVEICDGNEPPEPPQPPEPPVYDPPEEPEIPDDPEEEEPDFPWDVAL